MTKRRRKKKEGKEREDVRQSWHSELHPDTKKGTLAIIAFMAAALLALSYIGKAGNVGNNAYSVLEYLLGKAGYFFAPLSFILIGFSLLFSERRKIFATSVIGGILFLLSSISLLRIFFGNSAGGLIGRLSGGPLLTLFDFWASVVITGGFFAISLILMLNIPLWRKEAEDTEEAEDEEESGGKKVLEEIGTALKAALERKTEGSAQASLPIQTQTQSTIISDTESEFPLRKLSKKSSVGQTFAYRKPPLDLLQGDRGTPSSGDIKANANIIKRTLENFGIDVEMAEVSIGPTVTQYTLKPAEGVKLSRIVALHNDLSLALAAHPIRIEAPIPGKALVGLEVPNKSIALVGLRALLENRIFQEASNPLLFVLGRDVTGTPVFADLARMPHLLVSGATGSGKSVSIHSIITSFLFRNPPEILRFIVVDPKRVELSVYNDIPHLLTPVITDPKKTVQALRWATKEMDRRYDLLSQHHSRDIVNFNSQAAKAGEDPLPYIIIIIDELADLMSIFPREVEAAIIRLAQMARAVGIHLIVATQRPSVEVITGLIKANITSRIAFQVASQIDSRTVLDMAGAEKLLGNGDMLFLAGDTSKPRRIQGAFVSEPEVKRVVDFLREETEAPEYDEAIFETKLEDEDVHQGDFSGEDDPLYREAKDLVIQVGKASASFLQRRLRVGYARAARLLDIMEARGIIGPADGAKPREVLVKENSMINNSIEEI
jgi:S-DNA-T family DNA segregation ATPase FtsK/SpoIIIE